MSVSDAILTKLALAHGSGQPLPVVVNLDGESIATTRFIERYQSDKRDAWPALARHVHNVIERPLVCEAALSLIGR